MNPVLSPAQMYALEKAYFDAGNPSLPLMERAAACVADEAEAVLGSLEGRTVYVLCGPGNNGGDGFAAARFAAGRGARVGILPLGSAWRGDAETERLLALQAGIPFAVPDDAPGLWIDAAFGIGLNRPLSESLRPVFDRIQRDRAAGSRVLSVDLPSGIDGLTGCVQGFALSADRTVTFQCAKYGHFFADGPDFCGELVIRDIGLPQPQGELLRNVSPADLRALLPARRRNSHKGTYGHLLIIAGSVGMAGAACLCADAALHMGVGLVTIACPASILPILQIRVPCAMCIPLPEQDGAISGAAVPAVLEALRGKTAVAIGPGLSRKASPAVLEAVLESGLPAVLDADGLNLLSTSGALRALLCARHVITPHPGEAARLVPGLAGNPVQRAQTLRELGCCVLYKGAVTVLCGAEGLRLTTSGTSGMAKGGSGDVLTGMTGALLAQGLSPLDAASAASELHGLCGEAAAREKTDLCMCAQDQIDCLPQALKQIS